MFTKRKTTGVSKSQHSSYPVRNSKRRHSQAKIIDALLAGAERAGGEGGLSAYFETQAIKNPKSVLALMGKLIRPLPVSLDETTMIEPPTIDITVIGE